MWVRMLNQNLVGNKDGSLQFTFRYRGPDLASATDEELISITERLNNILKRLNGGWAIYAESQRVKSQEYLMPDSFPDVVTQVIEEERKEHFSQGNHYENAYYFTLVYLPPPDNEAQLSSFLIEGEEKVTPGEEHVKYFCDEAAKVMYQFMDILPEAAPLSADETLTYLHSTISDKNHPIKMPEIPMYLDGILYDAPLKGGMKPKLGDKHLRVVSLIGYPGSTWPGIFDGFNNLDFEFRWVTRFIALDKREAEAEAQNYQKLWFGKRKGLKAIIGEEITKQESNQIDEDALAKADDSAAAVYEINADISSYGRYTNCVVILHEDKDQADKNAKEIAKLFERLRFNYIIETYNAVDAWFGSIPGMCRSNVRRPLFSTKNLAHALPISAIYSGPKINEHLNAPVLLYTETTGNTPMRLDLHIQDTANTLVVGPPGSGKSALLASMARSNRKYKKPNIHFFDIGGSIRALTAGVGGIFYDLAGEESGQLSFQVLANIDDETERRWAKEWVELYLETQLKGRELTPEERDAIWQALTQMGNSDVEHRTISVLRGFFEATAPDIAMALNPICLEGPFASLFDAKEDTLKFGRWQAYEMDTLMKTPSVLMPTLFYIFHRIEKALNGDLTIIYLDEAWKYFKTPIFVEKIIEWLKVLRKSNAYVVFATQSLQDIYNSPIAPIVMDSCPNKIFLANPNAIEERSSEIYSAFGLNQVEIAAIAEATPKKDYYYKSSLGSRPFRLALGPIELAYCGSSSKEDQQMVKRILAEHGSKAFNQKWLEYKKLPKAAEKIRALGG